MVSAAVERAPFWGCTKVILGGGSGSRVELKVEVGGAGSKRPHIVLLRLK